MQQGPGDRAQNAGDGEPDRDGQDEQGEDQVLPDGPDGLPGQVEQVRELARSSESRAIREVSMATAPPPQERAEDERGRGVELGVPV